MKTTTKVQKTLAQTIDQLGKDIARMEKKVAAMRRRVGAAIRKHAKLQERIARLEKQGRIVSLSHDYEVLAGINCWYVKAESLNPNPDSNTNYYYETTYNEQAGYGCSCESLSSQGCKHIRQLSATFAPVDERTRKEQEAAERFGLTVEQVRETLAMPATVLNNANRGFQLMR